MSNNVYCLSRAKFKETIKDLTEQQFMATAFISVHEPLQEGKEMFGGCSDIILESAPNVLNLWFDDAEEEVWMPEGYKLTLFNEEMALTIREFFLVNRDKKQWLIHCTAGQCRSGAIGDVISNMLGIHWFSFKGDNPQVKPNPLVRNLLTKTLLKDAQIQ